MAKTVVGLYSDFNRVHDVVQDLVDHGFARENISLVVKDGQGYYARGLGLSYENVDAFQAETADIADHEGESAARGVEIGATLGGIAGLVIGLGALSLPGIGPVVAAGPILTTLSGAGIGAVTGGMVGALSESGIVDAEAGALAEAVRDGSTLVMVQASDEMADQAAQILNRYSPVDLPERQSGVQKQRWEGFNEHGETFAFDDASRLKPEEPVNQGARVYNRKD